MRNVPPMSSSGGGKWFSLVVLACCLEAAIFAVAAEDLPSITAQSEPELENAQQLEMSKRGWDKELKIWGKRAWTSLHGGWGAKRSAPSTWEDQMVYNSQPIAEKRAWQRLQSGWGKRFSPDDEMAINQLASMLERDQQMEQPYTEYGPEGHMNLNNDDKRGWGEFHDGWGKRSNNWNKMRGVWGKRDPAWSNLKGLWGKRSMPNEISK
ncbi:unnamed protein product [Brassicogethes aeneus]|uniref:Uncharacterized protein n=1 Tax=Brassicogethes aeneus TaxID=1431903 RepID=A0A9P0BE20_BRAAE|nr:unnamed protein product [Brassicogethes aeneus]